MGKGVGMATAVRVATGKSVRANAVDSSARPFRCEGCGVPVDRVNGYWIHKEDPELARWIEPFFRLPRGDAHQHAECCKYTPAGQVRALVAEAEAIEDSINPFERARPDGPFVFRLNVPTEEVRRERAADQSGQKTDHNTRVEHVWSGRRLEAFCRSAVGLARLWQELEGPKAQAELRRHVIIRNAGRRVPWTDFFFGPRDIARFADKTERKELDYSVALLLHARRKRRTQQGKAVMSFTPVLDPDASTQTRVAVEAYGEERFLNLFEPGRHYIVFGRFWHLRTRPWTLPNTSTTIIYRNFAVKLFQPSQIAEVQVVDPRGRRPVSPAFFAVGGGRGLDRSVRHASGVAARAMRSP